MILRLILFIASAFAFAEGPLPGGTPDLFQSLSKSCEKQLSAAPSESEVIKAYMRFRVGNLPNFRGFYIETKRPSKYPDYIEWYPPELKRPFWRTEKWVVGDRPIQFVDIGFENLADDSELINRRIAEHVMEHPKLSLKVLFDDIRSSAVQSLHSLRWNVHGQVIDFYKEEMEYLTPEDILQLVVYNQISTHNDVFALMEMSDKPIDKMSAKEFLSKLLMTLQISYFGNRNYLEPTIKGVVRAAGLTFDESEDRLPWEYLVPAKYRKNFRNRIYARFRPDKACEFNRYQRFARFPTAAQSYFLMDALMRVHDRGLETILAVTTKDIATKKFMMDGFKKVAEIPSDENPSGELRDEALGDRRNAKYLLYLSVDSAEFSEFFNKLALGGETVKVEKK
jgi:hypothetical protein